MKRGEAQKFVRQVAADPPEGCVIWPGRIDRAGYGRIRHGGRMANAHRVSLALHSGHDPGPEYEACHTPLVCHSKACISPLHLRWASRAENIADRLVEGKHTRGERSGMAKLTAAQVTNIRSDPRAPKLVAADYGVHRSTICRIRRGDRWRSS